MVMEILGMSIAIAAIVAAGTGVVLRNVVGYLGNSEGFDPKQSAASAIMALIIAIPTIVAGFTIAFKELDSIPEEAQLVLFVVQVGTVAGFDALLKGGAKAAAKTKLKKA